MLGRHALKLPTFDVELGLGLDAEDDGSQIGTGSHEIEGVHVVLVEDQNGGPMSVGRRLSRLGLLEPRGQPTLTTGRQLSGKTLRGCKYLSEKTAKFSARVQIR